MTLNISYYGGIKKDDGRNFSKETNKSEWLCIDCKCHIESTHIKAVLNELKEHELFLYSCPECPNITFEFCDERDLNVLQCYLMDKLKV